MLKRIEEINKDMADIIARISFKDFNEMYIAEKDKNGELENTAATYRRLTGYCIKAISNNYKTEKTYNYAAGQNCGRLFTNGTGLQNIPSQFRGVLSRGIYTDFDMINCHPCCLYKICQSKGIATPNLFNYINNREHYLRLLSDALEITKSEAKQLFIISINSDKPIKTHNRKIIKLIQFIDFDNEMKNIQDKLISISARLCNEIKSVNYKAKTNMGGCLVNYLMCDMENKILNKAMDHLINLGYNPIVPMFDGMMIANTPDLNVEEILSQLNFITQSDGLKWIIKPHNLELLPLLTQVTIPPVVKQVIFADNVIELGRVLYQDVFKNKLIAAVSGDKSNYYLKLESNNLWSRGDVIRGQIENWLTQQELYIGKIGNETPLNNNYKALKDCRDRIINESLANPDPDFIRRIFNASKLKLNFRNGVYDFKEMRFINDKSAIDGFFLIEYDYSETENEELINDVYRRILNPIFACVDGNPTNTQLRDCIIYRLARAVAGYSISEKNWFQFLGMRDSGKGVITSLLQQSIGQYFTTCDSGNFIMRNSNNDAARNNTWLYGYELNRIIAINEFQTKPNDKNHLINGQVIKSITSGGDFIETRPLFGMPIKIQLQATLMFLANEIPPCQPMNTYETATIFNMPSKFIDTSKPYEKLPGYSYFERDNNIKDWILSDGVGLAMMHIFIRALKRGIVEYPADLKEEIADEIQADGANIREYVEFTGQEDDKLTIREIEQHLASHGLSFNKKILAGQLLMIGGVQYRTANSRGFKFVKLSG